MTFWFRAVLAAIFVVGLISCGEPGGPLVTSNPPAPSILTAVLQGADTQSPENPTVTLRPVSVDGGTAFSVLVTWTQCIDDDFAWYTVFRSEDPDISSDPSQADTSMVFSGVWETSWTDTDVGSGGKFYYAVRTTDTEDLFSWSNEASVDVPQDDPPTPSTATASYTGNSQWPQITVNWTECSDGDFHSYGLYRSLSPGIQSDTASAELLKVFQQSGDTSYEDNNLEGDTPYWYAVRTWDLGEQSSWSNEVSVTTPVLIPLLTVFFIDPSHGSYSGDAILVRTPGNSYYLIDGGDRGSSWSCGEDEILPLLDSLGVTELNGIVGTHPHADHIGGLIAVLDAMPVGTVWDSGYEHTTQTYEDYLEAILDNGADYVTPRRGDLLSWDDEITVECIHPVDPVSDRGNPANNASVTLRITYGEVSFLFTGDLETDGGEEVILQALAQGYIDDISAQVLKVGHHGSYTSTSQAWLDAIQPEYAAIEVGVGNPFGHPHAEVLNRLEGIGADIYRTDLDGTFIFTTDGTNIDVYP